MKNNMKFMYGLIALFILAGISYAATTITGSGITTTGDYDFNNFYSFGYDETDRNLSIDYSDSDNSSRIINVETTGRMSIYSDNAEGSESARLHFYKGNNRSIIEMTKPVSGGAVFDLNTGIMKDYFSIWSHTDNQDFIHTYRNNGIDFQTKDYDGTMSVKMMIAGGNQSGYTNTSGKGRVHMLTDLDMNANEINDVDYIKGDTLVSTGLNKYQINFFSNRLSMEAINGDNLTYYNVAAFDRENGITFNSDVNFGGKDLSNIGAVTNNLTIENTDLGNNILNIRRATGNNERAYMYVGDTYLWIYTQQDESTGLAGSMKFVLDGDADPQYEFSKSGEGNWMVINGSSVRVTRPIQFTEFNIPVCNSNNAGMMAYNATSNKHIGCNGSSWNNLY